MTDNESKEIMSKNTDSWGKTDPKLREINAALGETYTYRDYKPEPIKEFRDIEEAYSCLGEWKERLFLQDWTIMLDFCKNPTLSGNKVFAVVEQYPVEQRACITFRQPCVPDEGCEFIGNPCQEKDLVHELLHLKIQRVDTLDMNYQTLEEIAYDLYLHRLTDQIARSLLMAKYNIKFDWFQNF